MDDTHSNQITAEFPRLTYSVAETEVLTGLSRATLYRRIAAGELRTVQNGRRRLVPTAELEKLCSPNAATAP